MCVVAIAKTNVHFTAFHWVFQEAELIGNGWDTTTVHNYCFRNLRKIHFAENKQVPTTWVDPGSIIWLYSYCLRDWYLIRLECS